MQRTLKTDTVISGTKRGGQFLVAAGVLYLFFMMGLFVSSPVIGGLWIAGLAAHGVLILLTGAGFVLYGRRFPPAAGPRSCGWSQPFWLWAA